MPHVRLGTDAAIMFADIMLLAEAMGVALELLSDGPRVEHPIRSLADVERLRAVDPAADLGFILEAIRMTRSALGTSAAVIGLAGGPFTMAAYLIEGGPSRDHAVAKQMLFAAPDVWRALLDRITDATVAYVRAQVAAGAQAIQVFDIVGRRPRPRRLRPRGRAVDARASSMRSAMPACPRSTTRRPVPHLLERLCRPGRRRSVSTTGAITGRGARDGSDPAERCRATSILPGC